MNQIKKHNYFVLTGAMGSGKSTTINELRKLGLMCIDEPARQILAEQRAIDGNGLPEKNQQLFTDLLLSRSIYQFKQMENRHGLVIYDRGIPDNIGYTKLFNLDAHSAVKASQKFQYNTNIFFLSAWKEIYQNDDERKITFNQSKAFGENIKKIYQDLGYHIIEVPMISAFARAQFIIDTIVKKFNVHQDSYIETTPECQDILKELKQREPIFHRREFGTSRAALENMTSESFWEIGASGRKYTRKDVINTLLERYRQQPIDAWETDKWHATAFCCQKISENNYLLTYILIQGTRITRRSTIWQKDNDSWKIVYHQGTVVEDL